MYKEDILRILKNANSYISGEAIRKELGISRMAVSKNISQLREAGYEIDSCTNKGYQLNHYSPRYDYTELAFCLPKEIELLFFDELSSANTYLKSIANDKEKNPVCAVAKRQTAGRGRKGHRFVSNSGIYASVLLHPKVKYNDLACLTAFAGVCICEALEAVCWIQPDIKWVNDILLNGKKICGILTEISMEAETASSDYAIIGFGINTDLQTFPEEIRDIAASIEGETGKKVDKSRLLCEIVKRICSLESELSLKHDVYIEKYRALCCTLGKSVMVLSNPPFEGKAVNILNDCSLAIQLASGEIKNVSFGEVSVHGLMGYS